MSAGEPRPLPTTLAEARQALSTPDAEARRLTVRALAGAPSDVVVGVLRASLGDVDWRVRKEAIQLAHAVVERADVVPVLVEALRAPPEEVSLRNAAVEALAGLGPSAALAVEAILAEDDEARGGLDADGRKLAVEVLAAARLPRSLPTVVRAAADPDPNVRAAATEAIGLIGGEAAAAALVAILDRASGEDAADRLLRLVALEGLNRLSAVVSLARLQPFVDDRILRHAAIGALARTGEAGAFGPIVEALGDSSRHVAETALRAFVDLVHTVTDVHAARAALKGLSVRGRERVFGALAGAEPSVRRGAIAVLGRLGDAAAIEALVGALADDELAEESELALVSLGDAAIPALIDVARAPVDREREPSSRVGALRMLGRFGGRPAAIAALRAALADADAATVAAAAAAFPVAIAAGAAPSSDDVGLLLAAAVRREPRVAATALQALRGLARRHPDVVRPHLADVDAGGDQAPVACALLAAVGGTEHVAWLSRAISAESARTRRAAVEALGAIGGEAAVRAIALAVTDEVPDVALAAIKALGRTRDAAGIGSPGVRALLRLLESSDDPALLSAAVRALGTSEDRGAAEALRPLAAAPSFAVACAALEALAEIGVDDLPELAFTALGHDSSVVVRAALDVLEAIVLRAHPRMRDGQLVPRLVAEVSRALEHPSWEVRRRAAELLPELATGPWTESVRPLLAGRIVTESEPAVREAIDRALGEIDARSAPHSLRPPRGSDGR